MPGKPIAGGPPTVTRRIRHRQPRRQSKRSSSKKHAKDQGRGDRMEQRYSRHWKRLLVLLPVMIATLWNASVQQPYYGSVAFGMFFTPMSVVYAAVSHVWVFGIQRRSNIVNALPARTAENSSKLAIVTGSNTGIGYETARTLVVDYGWEVVLACRSKDKAVRAMDAINMEAQSDGKAVVLDVPLDLTDFDSIEAFSNNIKEHYDERPVDVLINNAGRNTSGQSGKFDLLFRANFLGHFVLTQQLLEKLRGGRIINLSSVMHHFAGTEKRKTAKYWNSMILHQPSQPAETYSASKLAAILFTNELNRRYGKSHGIKSMSVNPGACSSDIWRTFPRWITQITDKVYLTPKQGSVPSVAAAVQQHWSSSVTYLQPLWLPNKEGPAFPLSEILAPYVGYAVAEPRLPPPQQSNAMAGALWDACEEHSGYKFS